MRFIKLFEKITEWEWYDDIITFKVFMHLLLTANWKDTQWHGIALKRGQRIISYQGLADEVHLSPKQIRTAITHLKRTGEVASERAKVGANKGQIITIENYEKYQGCEPTEGKQQGKPRGKGKGKQRATDIEDVELSRTIDNIPTVLSDDRPTKADVEEIIAIFNQECPSLPKVLVASDARVKKVKSRLAKHSKDELRLAFQKIEASDFATGKGKGESQWCSFDWIVDSEAHLVKILEGQYDNKNNARVKAVSDMRNITEGMTKEEYEDMERRFK